MQAMATEREKAVQRRLAATLSVDVEGYSRLFESTEVQSGFLDR